MAGEENEKENGSVMKKKDQWQWKWQNENSINQWNINGVAKSGIESASKNIAENINKMTIIMCNEISK